MNPILTIGIPIKVPTAAIVVIGMPPMAGEILSKIANVTRNNNGAATNIPV